MFGQLEYRFPIWSIIGGTLFLDGGQVFTDLRDFAGAGFHLTGGAGVRLAFSDRSMLCVELGFNGEALSQESFAVIVRSGHAF